MTAVLTFAGLGATVPDTVREVVLEVERLRPRLGATIPASGGIKREALDAVLRPVLTGFGFHASGHFGSAATIAPKELDYVSPERWTTLSIQAGRASTNNGALLAVLAAASTRDVDWAIVLVPARYKNSNTYDAVMRQLRELEASPGIRLELEGAVVVEY